MCLLRYEGAEKRKREPSVPRCLSETQISERRENAAPVGCEQEILKERRNNHADQVLLQILQCPRYRIQRETDSGTVSRKAEGKRSKPASCLA